MADPLLPPRKIADSRSEMTELILPNDTNTLGNLLGGRLMHHYGEVVHRPAHVWWALTGIGVATALLMWLYHFFVNTGTPATDVRR